MRPEDVLQVYAEIADEEHPPDRMQRRRRSSRWRGRHVVLTGVGVALLAAPFGVAATGDALREGQRNGTTTRETEIIGNINEREGKGGFVTRQSNVATGGNAGGAAIYGCRTPVGGTAGGTAPCLRASNLSGGSAFEFATSAGTVGLFSVGNPAQPNPGKPFTTNATGVATGLNADQVDGQNGPFLADAPNSVETANIADNAVTNAKLADDAVANAELADNAVNTGELADNAVTTAKIADAAVTTGKLADNAVTSGKIANGQVRGPDVGPVTTRTESVVVPNNDGALLAAGCLAGEELLSGGAFWSGPNLVGRTLGGSFRFINGWIAAGRNTSGAAQTLTAQAICLQN